MTRARATPTADPGAARDQVAAAFQALSGRAPTGWLFVPGRIEVLGKHTDYAGGRSLTCAAERGIVVAFGPRDDGRVAIVDAADRQRREFPLAPDLEPRLGHWSNYPMTVARRLARNFPGVATGADVAFLSNLPRAAGLSTSSALITAAYLVLSSVNDLAARPEYISALPTREMLAGYLGSIENGQAFGTLAGDHGVGTRGGSEDHTAILLSEAGALGCYRYHPVARVARIALDPDLVFSVASSGISAAKTGSARGRYNRASALVTALVEEWRRATGRADPTLADALASSPAAADELKAIAGKGTPVFSPDALRHRLEHFMVEDGVVLPAAIDALEGGRLEEFGRVVDESQRAAEQLLGNQVPETISLARLAREHGAIAASAFGAGFGGSVWALVDAGRADAFKDAWHEAYVWGCNAAVTRGAMFFTTRPGAGASLAEKNPRGV